MKRVKIAIIGVGNVGSTLAYQVVNTNICDELILINRNKKKAWAEVMDLNHAMGFSDVKMHVTDGDYSSCNDADIVVLSVGAPYKINMTRLDMLERASDIIKDIVPKVMESGFNGIFIVVTNPVDSMTYLVQKISGLPTGHVIGTGTALDSARITKYLADIMDVDARSLTAFCVGEHGDSQIIPWSQITVGGKKFLEIMNDNPKRFKEINLDVVADNISKIAYKIIEGKGSTSFGIASITNQIIKAIIKDENKIFPVSTMLNGEYGEKEIYIGVPAVLTSNGVKELVEYNLTDRELQLFKRSVMILKEANKKIL